MRYNPRAKLDQSQIDRAKRNNRFDDLTRDRGMDRVFSGSRRMNYPQSYLTPQQQAMKRRMERY
jgi:hypothetical protein